MIIIIPYSVLLAFLIFVSNYCEISIKFLVFLIIIIIIIIITHPTESISMKSNDYALFVMKAIILKLYFLFGLQFFS